MKGGMKWRPEEKDQKVNQYLESKNRAPYAVILAISLIAICAFTVMILMGTF